MCSRWQSARIWASVTAALGCANVRKASTALLVNSVSAALLHVPGVFGIQVSVCVKTSVECPNQCSNRGDCVFQEDLHLEVAYPPVGPAKAFEGDKVCKDVVGVVVVVCTLVTCGTCNEVHHEGCVSRCCGMW